MGRVRKPGEGVVMRVLGKFVVCLALLLAVGVILPKPGLAQDDFVNNPIPEVLGVKLGGDIRDYPGMAPDRPYYDGSTVYERESDAGITFEGIPVTYSAYTVYENRISRIYFCIQPDNWQKLLTYFRATYGEFRKDDDGVYRWNDLYFDIDIEWRDSTNKYFISFRHLPLINKRKSERLGIQGVEYNNIYLNEPIAKYKGKVMMPYSFLKPEMDFAPGRMDYRRFVEDAPLGGRDSIVVYQTWIGIIYQIKVFFRMEEYDNILAALREKYKQWDPEFMRDGVLYHWSLGEYEIILGQLEKDPEHGMITFRYWPLWRQATVVEAEYERLNKSIFGLDSHKMPEGPVAPPLKLE